MYALCLYQIEVTLHQWTLANAVMVRNNWENIVYMMTHCFRTWHNDGILLMQWYILIMHLHIFTLNVRSVQEDIQPKVLLGSCQCVVFHWGGYRIPLWPPGFVVALTAASHTNTVLSLAWDSSNETGLPFMNCWGVDHVSRCFVVLAVHTKVLWVNDDARVHQKSVNMYTVYIQTFFLNNMGPCGHLDAHLRTLMQEQITWLCLCMAMHSLWLTSGKLECTPAESCPLSLSALSFGFLTPVWASKHNVVWKVFGMSFPTLQQLWQ